MLPKPLALEAVSLCSGLGVCLGCSRSVNPETEVLARDGQGWFLYWKVSPAAKCMSRGQVASPTMRMSEECGDGPRGQALDPDGVSPESKGQELPGGLGLGPL